jgi:NAD(P)H-hydrate epimerase
VSAERELLYSVAAVRELDRRAIASGIPARELMRRAGAAAARLVETRFREARRILVVAGPGNNGGDGYDLASELHARGYEVRVVAPLGPPRSAEAQAARAEYLMRDGLVIDDPADLSKADLLVDALFGVGFRRAEDEASRQALAALAGASARVLALDVPSGVDADSGAVPGPAARATLTLCFIAAKRGLFTGRALDHVGEVLVDDLAVPTEVFAWVAPAAVRIGPKWLHERLEPRRRDVHKGHFGHVLVVGGARGFGGAARLAAEGALRAGAGWVSVATELEHVPALLAGRPELMARGFEAIEELLLRATVLAVGPGLGREERARHLFERALASGKGLVLDADALALLASSPRRLPPGTIITPHPGEAARLLGCEVDAVQADRFAAAERLAADYGCIVVLKGAGTVIAGEGLPSVIEAGNPAMASAGMGDVLTGVIAALIAQGLPPGEAARAGALAHAVAGDRAAPGPGGRGLIASDLLAMLPKVLSS